MKRNGWLRSLTAAIAGLTWSALAFAQSQAPQVDVTTTHTTSEVWYANWWIWAGVGVAVFLIIVIALTSRGGRSA
jgi:hypothetical protein